MAATALVTGSRFNGTLTFWDAAGKVQQILYWPAITAASVNGDNPGPVYSIAYGSGPIAAVYIDTGRVAFINPATLRPITIYQYDTSDPITGYTKFPYRAFAVGSETWVFSSGWEGSNQVYLDKFNASGVLTSTTTLGAGRLTDVASWDNNTFYLLFGFTGAAFIWKWTVGGSLVFVADITSDTLAGETTPGATAWPEICMHGPNTLVISDADSTNTIYSNIALFDVSSGGCTFVKHYMVSGFPNFSALPETTAHKYTFGVASDGTLIYTGTQDGPTMWTINPATDVVAIFNQDVLVQRGGTGPAGRQAAGIFYEPFPDTPAHAATFSVSEQPMGMTGISVRDFAGRTFSLAPFDGNADVNDIRYWPETAAPLARLPDESYVAEVRSEARLMPGIRMDGG